MTGLVLGVSVSHCGAACLAHDGQVLVAIAEERLSGRRKDRIFGSRPSLAVDAVLREVGADVRDVELAVLCLQEERRLPENDVARNLQLRPLVERQRVRFMSHHLGHAYAVYGCSGFDQAAIMVADGRGSALEDLEAASTAVCLPGTGYEAYSIFRADGATLVPLWKQLMEPAARGWDRRGLRPYDSCGALFESVAHFVFGDTDAAGKVMALAPFGHPEFDSGEIFDFTRGGIRASDVLRARVGPTPPAAGPERQRLNANLACSAQLAAERVVLELASRAKDLTGERRLCWSGGVALNCVANERLLREGGFDEVFILPGSDDRGASLGAAFYGEQLLGRLRRSPLPIRCDAWGAQPAERGVARAIGSFGRDGLFACRETSGIPETAAAAAAKLSAGQVGGLFSGRAELGPRALGCRSILGDPRSLATKDRMNATVKLREGFRPFGPAVLEERAGEWFDFGEAPHLSPFMLRAVGIRQEVRALIAGASHVDGSARLQTLPPAPPTLLRSTIEAFDAMTGVPMLLNTSFNLRGEPMVERAEDALWILALTDLDFVAFDRAIVETRVGRPEVLRWRVSVPAEVRAQLGGSAGDREILVRTPFGESVQHLYASVIRWLRGIEDGVSIADLAAATRGAGLTVPAESEAQFSGRLGVLRRRGLLQIDPRCLA